MNVPIRRLDKAQKVNYLRENEMKTLLEQPSVNTDKGLRDKTILVLLYDSAARVQELINIRLCDLSLGDISTVMLHGKGSKIRTVPIMKKTADLIKQYIAVFHNNASLRSEDYLFYIKHKWSSTQLHDDTVRHLVGNYAKAAKAVCASMPDNVHPHMFRHSRAMHLYQNGMELVLISQWLGHSHIDTTLVYAYADTEMKRKAIESATQGDSILRTKDSLERYTITDEATLKRLCGLR
jgi:site-specific recombinase XerD